MSPHECPDDDLRPFTAAQLFVPSLRPPVFVFEDDKQGRAELVRADIRADWQEHGRALDRSRDPRASDRSRRAAASLAEAIRANLLRRWRQLRELSIGYVGEGGELVPWP